MNKLIKISLILLSLTFVLMAMSSDIDRDLGWHLRFGQDAWSGQFPYLDTYTWTHNLQPWTNHEWGTDILFWPIFRYFGYLPILFFYGLIVWLSFIFINKIYSSRLTVSGLFFSFLGIFAVSPVLVPRPAVFLLPFLAIILWTLKRTPEKNLFYLWPPVFWFWSMLHGSWIFGFIVINIFLGGQIAQILLKKYFNWNENKTWQWRDIGQAIIWQISAFLILVLNPYGTKIWVEAMEYFTKNYFKLHITEWVPSYTFPVFWLPLILATVGGVLIIYAWRKKRANLSEVLVYVIFFYAAWKYKRNMVLPALICVPLFTLASEYIKKSLDKLGIPTQASGEISEKTKILNFLSGRNLVYATARPPRFHIGVRLFKLVFLLGILALGANYFLRINWENNPWANKQFMFYQIQFPFEAAEVLQKEIGDKKTPIFNEFGWGAYLNWAAPQALVFLDGRGTATWMWSSDMTYLEKYRMLKFEKEGLKELEKMPVQYILLKSEKVSSYTRPDLVNRLLFPKNKLAEILFAKPSQLELDLRASSDWTLIHEDYLSNLWKRTNQESGIKNQESRIKN